MRITQQRTCFYNKKLPNLKPCSKMKIKKWVLLEVVDLDGTKLPKITLTNTKSQLHNNMYYTYEVLQS